jgi:hypothetical protein
MSIFFSISAEKEGHFLRSSRRNYQSTLAIAKWQIDLDPSGPPRKNTNPETALWQIATHRRPAAGVNPRSRPPAAPTYGTERWGSSERFAGSFRAHHHQGLRRADWRPTTTPSPPAPIIRDNRASSRRQQQSPSTQLLQPPLNKLPGYASPRVVTLHLFICLLRQYSTSYPRPACAAASH